MTTLGPHLHRIGDDIVAAYLVDTDDGITVIDAGLSGHWHDLQAELAAMGRPLTDIRGIVLTHGDSDHIGFAERLRKQLGIPVYIGAADAARARGEEKSKPSWGHIKVGALLGFLWSTIRKGGLRNTYLTEVVGVQDGQILDLPGSPRIIALPGHSPGSIAIHIPAANAVFVGDGLTTRHVLTGQVGPQPAPFTDDPQQALASLDRLAGIDAKWLLPGHGAPWSGGIPEAVKAIHAAAAEIR
jgi:glyoxylase-like metal-dependent hydrolase (beta-lactamase superfamily II)